MLKEYKKWLYHEVIDSKPKRKEYDKLFDTLFDTPFKIIHPYDENRAMDGIECRWIFSSQYGVEDIPELEGVPCSVLEMLISLAFKMFNITDNPEDDFSPGFWFWEMIDNLGLIDQSNGKFSKSKVSKILYIFNNRLYDADGRGGNIFILYEYDIRKKEIWWQMCHYLDSYLNL